MKHSVLVEAAAVTALLLSANAPARAAASESTNDRGSVQVVVTVESKHHGQPAPKVEQEDVAVYQDGHRAKVTSWLPLTGQDAAVQFFLVLDDSSRTNAVGTHIEELRGFLQSLPPSVNTAVGYMTNGRVQVAQGFTADHEAAAKAVRLPSGSAGSNGSPYFSLSDLAKHWPDSSATARRVVLLLTDGIDPYDTSRGSYQDIYLEASIADAQRAGIQVYSIFLAGKGNLDGSLYGINEGQGKLGLVADQTGGRAYSQGLTTPVSLTPYLGDFKQRLDSQYRLVFESANDATKPALEDIRVKTELAGAVVTSASKAYVIPR
jgi:VWFA-related protein